MWLIAPDRLEARLPGAPDTDLPQRTKGLRSGAESLDIVMTPTMRSWNQIVRFLTDWEGLRGGRVAQEP